MLQFFTILTSVVQSTSSLTLDHLGSQIYDGSLGLRDVGSPALRHPWADNVAPQQLLYGRAGRTWGRSEVLGKGDLGMHWTTNVTAHSDEEKLSRQKRLLLEFPDNSRLILVAVLSIPIGNYKAGGGVLALTVIYRFVIKLPNETVTYIGMRESEHHHYHHHIPYEPPVPAPAPPAPAPPASASAPSAPATAPPAPATTTQRGPSFAIYKVPQDVPGLPPSPPAPSYAKSVDAQRKAGFMSLEAMLNAAGLPGHWCLLKAVCEVAAEPVDGLGMLGDMVNMFMAPGYGEGSSDLLEYAVAEEVGLYDGDCTSHFPKCPADLNLLLEKGLGALYQEKPASRHAPPHGEASPDDYEFYYEGHFFRIIFILGHKSTD